MIDPDCEAAPHHRNVSPVLAMDSFRHSGEIGMIKSVETNLSRDEKGRPVGPDGNPLSGLASVAEVMAATGLSRSQIYAMIHRGDLATKRFGRSVRVPWRLLRSEGILGEAEAD